jgi:hypothetical protein
VLPPAFGFTALAVLLSVATRNSAAGIRLPVVAGLTMQLFAFIDAPELVRRLLITAFGAWHGLLTEPPFTDRWSRDDSRRLLVVCLVVACLLLRGTWRIDVPGRTLGLAFAARLRP